MNDVQKIISSCEHPFLLMLIGPPLSGKDTLIREMQFPSDTKIVSRDQIVLDLSGIDDYNVAFKTVNQSKVNSKLDHEIRFAGRSNLNTIINMTNMAKSRRKSTLSFFPNHIKIAVVFPILLMEEYRKRNSRREELENKFIPEGVIRSMIDSFEPPTQEEGFDQIVYL